MAEPEKEVTTEVIINRKFPALVYKGERAFNSAFWHAASVSLTVAIIFLLEIITATGSFGSVPRALTYFGVMVLATFGLIYFFVLVLKQRTANTTRLKQEVTSAFLRALDQSSFNPHRFEEKNEQSSPQ